MKSKIKITLYPFHSALGDSTGRFGIKKIVGALSIPVNSGAVQLTAGGLLSQADAEKLSADYKRYEVTVVEAPAE